MSTLVGRIVDRDTGRPLAARVQVLGVTGAVRSPAGSILKPLANEIEIELEELVEQDAQDAQ